MNKVHGDMGEAFVATLLRGRGYSVREIGGNYPVIDLEVEGAQRFRVSVKTSMSKRHVRLGREASVQQLRDTDFLFALMPKAGDAGLNLDAGAYDLLIVPGAVAREDALHVHRTYFETPTRSGGERKDTAGIIVKEYSGRPPQKEAWARWLRFNNGWSALPAA